MSAPMATPSTQPDSIVEEASQDMQTDLPTPPGITKSLSTTSPGNPVAEPSPKPVMMETEETIPPSQSPIESQQSAFKANPTPLERPSEQTTQLQQPTSLTATKLPPPPQNPKPSKGLISDTILPPPPVAPFSKSRPHLPPIRLMPTMRSSFTHPSKASIKTTTKNSRTAFLTAALSPSFVSAKPLHTRAHSTISEIVGNLAPERYLSLPPRSTAAAKALLATSVCKELRDVHKLETIRRRHGDVEGCGGWFDYVLDSLGDAGNLRPHVQRLKNFAIRPWEGLINRVEFLPLESIRIDSVMGHDFTPFVKSGVPNLRVPKNRAEAVDTKIQRMKNAIKANTAKVLGAKKTSTNVALKPALAPLPQPIDDPMDDDLLAPPVPTHNVTATATPTSKSKPSPAPMKPKSVPSADVVTIDVDEPVQPTTNESVQKPKVQLPVFLVFDDENKKVSLDFEIREVPSKPTSPEKQLKATPAPSSSAAMAASKATPVQAKKRERTGGDAAKMKPKEGIQTPTSVKPFRAGLTGTDFGNLDDLLGDIDNDIVPPKEAEKAQNSDPEVVLVKEGTKAPAAPKLTKRRTKRKRADKKQERIEIEQRASRMRSAVVSALQEDPDARRQRNGRTSCPHPGVMKKVANSSRRMSRRSKKNTAPILDSSGSEKEFRKDQDDDFAIDADDIIEVLPVRKANGTRAPPPDLSPPRPKPQAMGRGRETQEVVTEIESLDGSDMVSPRIGAMEHRGKQSVKKVARVGSAQYARAHRSGGPSSRRERHQHADAETHEGEPELWNREVLKVERLLEESSHDCDPLLNQIRFNPYRFYEQVPIIRRVIHAAKAQHSSLVDMDKIDEHEEMNQFYADRRNERTYSSGNGCSGTEFLEQVFHQTERERLNAMHGYAGEETSNALEVDDEKLDLLASGKGTGGVVNLDGDGGHSSSASQESSDGSSESSEEEMACAAGSKRSRSQARSRASKARELQSRVCGDLLATMTNESKRRVLRWAERDFTWFDKGVDVMEIVASRAYKRCNRCETGRGDNENCEESILLKLWKDMSWRKVRRMRHRSSNTT